MKHSLYYKFILGYLVFGVLGFFAVATTASELTYNQLISQESETLYDEANLQAGTLIWIPPALSWRPWPPT